ncbi:hypothetical protein BDW69DRAFT_166854 [Aspergillus filifer]
MRSNRPLQQIIRWRLPAVSSLRCCRQIINLFFLISSCCLQFATGWYLFGQRSAGVYPPDRPASLASVSFPVKRVGLDLVFSPSEKGL